MKQLGSVALFAAALCSVAAGQQKSQPNRMERTETGAFPTGGMLRIEKSQGELSIVGWDRPEFEIQTIVSAPPGAPDRELPAGAVRVNVSTQGSEVVVRTGSRHFGLPYPGKGQKFWVDYKILVPRTALIVLEHHSGNAHLDGVTGDVRASVGSGLLSLRLPSGSEPAVDAKSTWGGIISDFRGRPTGSYVCTLAPCNFGTFPFGHRLEEAVGAARQTLHLRVGYGDIMILRASDSAAFSGSDQVEFVQPDLNY